MEKNNDMIKVANDRKNYNIEGCQKHRRLPLVGIWADVATLAPLG